MAIIYRDTRESHVSASLNTIKTKDMVDGSGYRYRYITVD